MHRILGAFSYLHAAGMVYCDMKPDNFMLEGTPPDVKLIDMGGVRRLDDPSGDVYGTRGYRARSRRGPHGGLRPVHDRPHAGSITDGIPFPERVRVRSAAAGRAEVLARHESLYRFLLKATQRDPNLRFQSADEMADQLAGVLREVVAAPGSPRPAESAHFQGDALAMHEELDAPSPKLLPDLKVRPDDPGAAFLLSISTVNNVRRRAATLRERIEKLLDSRELELRLAQALIELESYSEAAELLDQSAKEDPFDWRAAWYRGYSFLAQGRAAEAYTAFDQVYNELPGELAVKLAVAMAAEAAGDDATAATVRPGLDD